MRLNVNTAKSPNLKERAHLGNQVIVNFFLVILVFPEMHEIVFNLLLYVVIEGG